MGPPPLDLLEDLALEGTPLTHRDGLIRAADQPVGVLHPSERRIEYDRPVDAALEARVRVERALFDVRSALLEARLRPHEPASAMAAWLDLRTTENPRLADLVPRLPPLENARVLELGGSGEATRGFLRAGVRRVDQLDVSPGMQKLARARLTDTERERLVQHTTFAERLPFADAVFDLVYSRHCVHHMDRSRVLPEVARVLKPTGAFLLIEPYVPLGLEQLVALRRRLVRTERGTDDPLHGRDLRLLRRTFRSVTVRAEPSLGTVVRASPRLARLVRRRVDPRLPERAVRLVGGRVQILAKL